MSIFRPTEPVVVSPGEGTHLDVLGEVITMLVSGKETNGAFTVLAERTRPGGGTPLHTHHNEDEALYVLEGEYDVRCGDKTVRAGPGSFVFAPREIPHKFTNAGTTAAAILVVVSPAGLENFFEEVNALPPPPDIQAVGSLATKYKLEIHPG
jgi:mannose-6-phosphate isomerase-like protein (cupin superfamily)